MGIGRRQQALVARRVLVAGDPAGKSRLPLRFYYSLMTGSCAVVISFQPARRCVGHVDYGNFSHRIQNHAGEGG
jgi:hypothetical protein